MKIMASGPINSWQIDGEIVTDFILWGVSKITADGDCSHEIKRHLLLGRKAMTNLDSILKSRDITLATKIHLVKAMVFPVVTYRCESWTIKKAERWRIDAFELWCWRRLLRAPWTARRSNQSIPKEISPVYSLEGLMLKLKLQYFGHLMGRADSFEKTLMLGKIEGRRRRGWQRMRWLDSITNSMDTSLGKLYSWWWTGRRCVLWFMGSQRVGHDWATKPYWMRVLISLHSLNKCLSAYDLLMLCVVFFKIFQYNLPFKITSCRLWRELFLQAIHRRIKIRAQSCRRVFHLLAGLHISSCWEFRLLPQRRWMNILV